MRRKMTRRICIAACSAALLFSGCTKLSDSYDEAAEESQTSSEEGVVEQAEKSLKDFAKQVNLQNYEDITDLVYMPTDAFILDSDIEWYVKRTALADITGIEIKDMDVDIEPGALERKAVLTVNKKSYPLNVKLDSDDKWKVVLPSLYIENFNLKAPKGCEITVNGEDVSSYKTPSSNVDNYDVYVFPAVAKDPRNNVTEGDSQKSLNIRAVSSIYGEFEQTVIPVSDSQTSTVICRLGDAETENILRSIKDIWNALYTDYKNGVEVSAISKYFSPDFSNTEMTDIMQNYFPTLEMGKENKNTGEDVQYSNFYMRETIPWNRDNYGAAILKANDSVLVTFGYRLDFTATDGAVYNVNKVCTITMSYDNVTDPNNPTYKIKAIDSPELFYDNDFSENDY